MLRILILTLAFALLLQGCAPPKPQPRFAVFDEREYGGYEKSGTASITGQAFVLTRGGDVKYGAGKTVHLNPVTTYSTEWFQKSTDGINLEAGDPRANAYHRSTTADGEGRFTFSDLPAGNYYIICPIYWEVVTGLYGSTQVTGCVAHATVTVRDGQVTKTNVTQE